VKCLIIGGNRFVGLRLANALDLVTGIDLHVLNRTGQVAHTKNAVIHKGDRAHLATTFLDTDWDIIFDFAAYTQKDAEGSLQFFKKVSRYIFISTSSVYSGPADRKEEDFRPDKFDLGQPAKVPPDYSDGKRRTEAAFTQQNQFPVLSVRFPFIVGPDDYTHRLDFHIDRTLRSDSIYFPNPSAKLSMVHSEDAARFLEWAMTQPKLAGPLNVASPDSISLSGLMGQIELITGIKPVLASAEKDDNHSPFEVDTDCFINTDRMIQAGFQTRPIAEWLPSLIGKIPTIKPRFVH